jgi:hypothetical protein
MGIYDAPTAVAVGGSANLPATNELLVDMHGKLLTSFPSLTPLTAMLTRLGDDPARNFRVDWNEEHEVPTTMIIATSETTAGTTIYVRANGTTLVPETMLFNPRTFDLRRVSGTPTTNTITVVISQGGTTSAAWNAGDVIDVLPPSIAENDATYRAVSVADSNVYNYIQNIKLQFGLTRTEDLLATHWGGPGSKRTQLKNQKYREFRIKKEKLILYGGRASSGTAPATIYQMGGLVYYLKDGTLYKDFTGIITESGFRSFLGDYKDQNPDSENIYLFTAGNVLGCIGDWGLGKVHISPESKTFGLDIWTYLSRGLKVNIVPMPILDKPVTRGWGFILDLDYLRLRTLKRDYFFPEALNVGQSEIIYDTYGGILSLLVGTESRHAMFVGADN